MKAKGVRLTEKQWEFVEEVAKQKAEEHGEYISASDVVRYAIDLLMAKILDNTE